MVASDNGSILVHFQKTAMSNAHQSDTNGSADVDDARRGFMQSALIAAGMPQLPGVHPAPADTTGAPLSANVPSRSLTLNINGTNHRLSLEPRVTLLDALREWLSMTGTRKGCDRGQCGARVSRSRARLARILRRRSISVRTVRCWSAAVPTTSAPGRTRS
jgi:hypothetical protein